MPNWIIIPSIVAVLALGVLVWRALSKNPDRVGQRIGLWIAALFFTFYGPFSAANPTWPPGEWAAEINAAKDFKDLWLAMIAMLVFSLANISDNLVRNYTRISVFSRFVVPIVTVAYFIAIVVGMTKYASFSENILIGDSFGLYWTMVWAGTLLGLVWEFLIALECT